MVTYNIESQFPLEPVWHPVWAAPAERTSVEDLIKTLALYRKNHPEMIYRLVKIEVIG